MRSTPYATTPRQDADADARTDQAEQDATRARQAVTAPTTRADRTQAAAAEEIGRIRADHQHPLRQLTTATSARISALGETRDALHIRAERAETDLDTARALRTSASSKTHPSDR